MAEKYCIDCKHFIMSESIQQTNFIKPALCGRTVDLVYKKDHLPCSVHRDSFTTDRLCGRPGSYWEPKDG